jgi:hypothetical protein
VPRRVVATIGEYVKCHQDAKQQLIGVGVAVGRRAIGYRSIRNAPRMPTQVIDQRLAIAFVVIQR